MNVHACASVIDYLMTVVGYTYCISCIKGASYFLSYCTLIQNNIWYTDNTCTYNIHVSIHSIGTLHFKIGLTIAKKTGIANTRKAIVCATVIK